MKRTQQLRLWKRWTLSLAASAVLLTPLPAFAAEATALDQLNEVFTELEKLHYSGKTAEELRDAAIGGMLRELNDPYTVYYDAEEWELLHQSFEQTYVGIGIQFVETELGLRILRVYAGSAAETAGLRAGDIVVGVGDKKVADYSWDELSADLLGPEGSQVQLTVANERDANERTIAITRKPFHIPTVEYGRTDDGTGYIRISSFSTETPKRVGEALSAFGRDGDVTSLVLDLRGNPGGYLQSVAEVAAYFIEEGPIMYAKNRNGNEEEIRVEGGSGVNVPIVVIVDGSSASASEVFAGAMQDYGLATVVGTKTFGKGSVQQLVSLETGGGLRVTVEHYFTPKKRPVNGVGITPDAAAATPLAQTLAALRATGAEALRIELHAYETIVNGLTFDHVVPVIREDGRVYVRSAALADTVDGRAIWDAASAAITIRGADRSATFDEETGLLLRDGSSFIDINAFAASFDSVAASAAANTVTLELK